MNKKIKNLYLLGGGGFCEEVIWIISKLKDKWNICGILENNKSLVGTKILDVPVVGTTEDWLKFSDDYFIVTIGNPRIRKKVVNAMLNLGTPKFATIIDPAVSYHDSLKIGHGSIICAGSILTTNISIGEHCIVNLGCCIGHRVSLEDFCTIAPNVAISGEVTLQKGVEVGVGSCIKQGITISIGSMVGMGTVVTKSILNQNCLIFGVPAKVIKDLEEF